MRWSDIIQIVSQYVGVSDLSNKNNTNFIKKNKIN